jgi:ribonucleoside-triphosphate reductase
LEYQNELQCKYTWGTVLHLYLWEKVSDGEACKSLVKKVLENYQLPYITITPTFSICPKHGYIAWEHDFCPKCDEEIGYEWEKFDVETRKIYTAK